MIGYERRDPDIASGKCGQKENAEVVSALMLTVLHTYEHRTQSELWEKLLEPMKNLVHCEDVKIVVRCYGPAPLEATTLGPFDPTLRRRMKPVTYVEQWSPQRIDGHAALTQRICRIPSTESNRSHWEQYEVTKSKVESLRCVAAVPLFDADGNVLAVAKFVNRCSLDGQPLMEFSRADLTALSAFSAIFACIIPHPFLGVPGAGLQRRPQAQILITDKRIDAVVTWQVPRELRGNLMHEIRYGEVDHDDAYVGRVPQDNWPVLPCGVLEPISGQEDSEVQYQFVVPGLKVDSTYAFSVRLRNQSMFVDWSEPSMKLSTFLAPPHSIGQEAVQLFPLSEHMVQVEWCPFDTCDPGLHMIEYRVIARTVLRAGEVVRTETSGQGSLQNCESEITADEQVVACFISHGENFRESATVANLQPNMTYNFAVEARYAWLGRREFSRALLSENFSFPTVDITLPAPQPLASDMVSQCGPEFTAAIHDRAASVILKWPYPSDLTPQLALQYRVASVAADHRGRYEQGPSVALQVSTWTNVRSSDCLQAQLVRDGVASDLRVLCDPALEGRLAVQLRVVMMPHGSSASPPSAWFHPEPPPPPQQVVLNAISSDEEGCAIRVAWIENADNIFDSAYSDSGAKELGPVGYGVHHDFMRGHGPASNRFQVRLRAVSAAGDPRGEWEELLPQMMPPRCKQLPPYEHTVDSRTGAPEMRAPRLYEWFLHEQRWFTQHGAYYEVQLRLGNLLSWSGWVKGNLVHIQCQPPLPCLGSSLDLSDIRTDSVKLTWMPFMPAEDGLRLLEYRVMCLEFAESSNARLEVGGRLVSWRMLDSVTTEAEAATDTSGKVVPLHYTVRGLLPERRYHFAIECRYQGLPPAIAAACAGRIETTEAMVSRGLRLAVVPESVSAVASLGQSRVTGAQSSCNFVVMLRWRFGIHPIGSSLPSTLCYQVCCLPDEWNAAPDLSSRVILPPALLSEHTHGEPHQGTFRVDRSSEFITAEAEIPTGVIEALLPQRPRTRFAVRLGELSSGNWGPWSESPSEAVDLTVASPSYAKDDVVTITEHTWGLYGTDVLPPTALHAVEALTVAWPPFQAPNRQSRDQYMQASPGVLVEHHAQLMIEYEVIGWAVHHQAPSLEDVRQTLCLNTAPSSGDAYEIFRRLVYPASMPDKNSEYRHWVRVPGDCLQPSKYHYFQVTARYLYPNGEPVPRPSGTLATALLSADPYRPILRKLAAPRLERFSSPYDDCAEPCAMLALPQHEGISSESEPIVVECREGCVYAGRPEMEPTVVASGDWKAIPPECVEMLSGDGTRVFIKRLQMSVCQFRLRRGGIESEASPWTDTSVWVPDPLPGHQLQVQMRKPSLALGAGGSAGATQHIQGLGVALGVGRDAMLYARLSWPRHAPRRSAVKLLRYQLRYREPDYEWHVLPTVDLPALETDTAESQVSELRHGAEYEFSVRLCNALGRWSQWSMTTVPLSLTLPAPSAPEGLQKVAALRVTNLSPSLARICWSPFSVPCRSSSSSEPPILLDGSLDNRACVNAEYELTVSEDSGGSAVSVIQHQGPVYFSEMFEGHELPWLEQEVPLEPHKAYIFMVRARLRTSDWGLKLVSSCLPSRLLPIAVGSPMVELELSAGSKDRSSPEAALHVDITVRGFNRNHSSKTKSIDSPGYIDSDGSDRVAAALAQYQLRSCLINSTAENWVEWAHADASTLYNANEHSINVHVPLHAAPSQLLPGATYIFSMRCSDAYGRWTEWSTASEQVSLKVPTLIPPLLEARDNPGANLRLSQLSQRAVLLEWNQFRSTWETPGAQKAVDTALERISYKLRMAKRLRPCSEWISYPIDEIESERRAAQSLSYEVGDLDERYEYIFYISARWVDVPIAFGSQAWSDEIASVLLPSRLQELHPLRPPSAEVSASDTQGIFMKVRWYPSNVLRDTSNVAIPGSRHQLRFAQVPHNFQHEMIEHLQLAWQEQAQVLERTDEPCLHEVVDHVRDLLPGCSYMFSIRIGDNYRWSDWSIASEPVVFALPGPIPSPGDVLEISYDVGVSTSVRLEWRPFRTSTSLTSVEYKIIALEWPFMDNSRDTGVLARLRRAAHESQNGSGGDVLGQRSFNCMGYVTTRNSSGGQLRGTGDRVEWKTDGLKPGRYYRFFVCARYVCLPIGATLPPSSASAMSAEPSTFLWPDEHCQHMQADNVAWEASLGRFGLWSSVVNTGHVPSAPSAANLPMGSIELIPHQTLIPDISHSGNPRWADEG
jgi:hypothetical protein